ncbi:MAG: TadG family pilus assembly protein [Geminicoccaceae bacterium]
MNESKLRQRLDKMAVLRRLASLRTLLDDQRGSIMPIMAAVIVSTSVGGALAVDVARAYSAREQQLLVAESAALAAATSLPNVKEARQIALRYAEKNMPGHGVVDENDIVFGNWDAASRSITGNGQAPNAVRVTARLSERDGNALTTIFAGLIGDDTVDVAASAAAGKFGVACLIALNPKGKGLKLDKDAQLQLEGCGAQSNATSKKSLEVKGESRLTASGICTGGSAELADPSAVSPDPTEHCPQMPNPMANFDAPEVGGCTYSDVKYQDKDATISPGVYCGGLKVEGNSTITMEPGLYIIDNGKLDLKGEATLIGEGVTIHLHDKKAEFDIGGSSRLSLRAPQDGPMRGLLIVQDKGDVKKENKWDSNRQSDLTGVVYLPEGRFKSQIESNITATEACFVLLASEIVISGKAKMSIDLTGEACRESLPAALSGRVALLE